MPWDRSTKIRGSAGVGLRKKARRLGEEVKLGCRWADLGRKRQDPTASWLRGHRLGLLLT